ncbi:putative multidrug ABC transporter ATP-binding protein YbhF [bioreactor metagenome]|uniref:Putative multidrug ABC transporter ATP-binding protein YbhF n=1 Tax=bioreactor metagenome TaxID=1076179 RepID=A0A644ZDX0_9ZZZZ|nr:ABC transporter ATP-binding protein [Candidatus Metalachnospira sp.]
MPEILELHKNYGKFTALDSLSMNITENSIFGFVGPNGAGKTTTMKIMAGLLTADSGSIYINGEDILKNPKRIRDKIGYMPDFFGVYDDLKVSEYMDFYAGTYYIPYAERGALIDNLLEIVDLSDKKDTYVDSLSRGMKQRLCLARSLVHDPDLIILDEPASGLDPRARVEMKEVLKQLREMGKTIIVSSHILPELAEMCSEIGIMDKGKLVTQGTVSEIMNKLHRKRVVKVKLNSGKDMLIKLLKEQSCIKEITESVDNVEFVFEGQDSDLTNILRSIVMNGIPVYSFSENEGNLEEIFMTVTGGEKND